jgi:enoyl-CoA hydratase/carnithine racemase
MDYKEIIYDQDGHVITITLNRPEVMNALSMTTYREFEAALNKANADETVRAIIITGAGKGFCSGDDVKQVMLSPLEVENRRLQRKREVRAEPTPATTRLMTMDKPTIAAVNGAAMGWGMDLALMCDIRIASERARFGELFVLRGLVPDVGGIYCLPLIVGISKAYELLYTGDIIDAREAERIGLVGKVVPPDLLMDEARGLARRISDNPPLAVRRIKEAVRRGLGYDVRSLGEYVTSSLAILFETEDHKEGAAAFLEKRKPVFRGL